ELILKDIETVEKKLEELKGHAKSGVDSEQKSQIEALEKIQNDLNNEIPAYVTVLTEEQKEFVSELWLLTDKPAIYLVNIKGGVDEPELKGWMDELKKIVPEEEKDYIMNVDCKTEGELIEVSSEEKDEMISMVDEYHGIEDIIDLAYKRLDLITFYTANDNAANAWTIRRGSNVKEAAVVIHTDMEQNFVAAEIINVEKLIEVGGWVKAKELGLIKNVNGGYIVEDGDKILVQATK
ncbi:MAG: DUF933 domain-containing protein, partial [bacterium]